MSLFRKVFNSQQEAAAGPLQAMPADQPEEDDLPFDEEISAGLREVMEMDFSTDAASVSDPPESAPQPAGGARSDSTPVAPTQQIAEEPEMDADPGEPAMEQATAAPEEPADADDLPARPDQTAKALDPELVERAARAQVEIERTRQRRQSQPHPQAPPPAAEETPSVEPAARAAAPEDDAGPEPVIAAPQPNRGRAGRRVRTRMLGFDQGADVAPDPIEKGAASQSASERLYPVGWLVVVKGPGTGNAFALYNGVATIGRGADQSITLDFGDNSISREKHAAIAYDEETSAFYLGHGGKSNIVRLNGRPVLSTEDLNHADTMRIGETTLRFVALCGSEFTWGKPEDADAI